jgi:hypothetical protein
MSIYAKFCMETMSQGKWQLCTREVFPFPAEAWQRQAGDTRTLVEFPFASPNRMLNTFLGGIPNEVRCELISAPKGVPKDISIEALAVLVPQPWRDDDYGGTPDTLTVSDVLCGSAHYQYGFSWLTLSELTTFDYETPCPDLSDPSHETTTYRRALGEEFFEHVRAMEQLGSPDAVRLVFCFES